MGWSLPAVRPEPVTIRYRQKLADFIREHTPLEDIESNEEVFTRFMAFLREVAIAYPGKTILVVTHLNVMETLLIHLGENPIHVDNLACLTMLTDGVQITLEGTEGITLARERV